MMNIPKKEGHYWARWVKKVRGTADIEDVPDGELEVMRVVRNSIEENDFMVMVPGVAKCQPLENFIWSSEVKTGWTVDFTDDDHEIMIHCRKEGEPIAFISISDEGVNSARYDKQRKTYIAVKSSKELKKVIEENG